MVSSSICLYICLWICMTLSLYTSIWAFGRSLTFKNGSSLNSVCVYTGAWNLLVQIPGLDFVWSCILKTQWLTCTLHVDYEAISLDPKNARRNNIWSVGLWEPAKHFQGFWVVHLDCNYSTRQLRLCSGLFASHSTDCNPYSWGETRFTLVIHGEKICRCFLGQSKSKRHAWTHSVMLNWG